MVVIEVIIIIIVIFGVIDIEPYVHVVGQQCVFGMSGVISVSATTASREIHIKIWAAK